MHYLKVQVPRPDYAGGPDEWILNNLTQFTILFGKNGSGKSILLRSWRDLDTENFHYISPERAGQMVFQANLMEEMQTGKQRRDQTQHNQFPNYRQSVLARIGSYLSARGAIDDPVDMVKPSKLLHAYPNYCPTLQSKLWGSLPFLSL